MEAIRCEGLTKYYGKVVAVEGLNLSIEEKCIFGFLGPNGAGKTTTIKLFAGLIRPSRGTIWIAGLKPTTGALSIWNKVGYLPEDPAFYGWMTGQEFLNYTGELFHLPSREIQRRCQELLEIVGLREAATRRIGGYSRGMRQRLGIAQALINRPEVLFLDEPCSALDPIGRREILEVIARLGERATVFMSTHILADVERVCNTVAIIDKGRLVTQAPIEALRERFARPVFELQFEGGGDAIADLLRGLPWVIKVEPRVSGESLDLRVHVSDVPKAKRELPKVVIATNSTLLRYELTLPTLEDIFLQLVGPIEKEA